MSAVRNTSTRSCIRSAQPDSFIDWCLLLLQTRNSSGDEIANVNFLCDDIHAIQNTVDSCINSATDRRGYLFSQMHHAFG